MKLNKLVLMRSALLLLIMLAASYAHAEIKDYEIRRLIIYQTECTLDDISRKSTDDGGVDFLATCQNQAFYPDGLLISCSDSDDTSSCAVKTEPISIELKLLQ